VKEATAPLNLPPVPRAPAHLRETPRPADATTATETGDEAPGIAATDEPTTTTTTTDEQ
jgi:hypothetical protein